MSNYYRIDGIDYDQAGLLARASQVLSDSESPTYSKDIFSFIIRWFDASEHISIQTSGSTGSPSVLEIPKRWMQVSAQATVTALGLKAGQTSLLCISVAHIGGMMMIVRSLEHRLALLTQPPSRLPRTSLLADFTAMVPLQVQSLLAAGDDLSAYGVIIIGGAPVSPDTELKLRPLEARVYATFGMTETVSHIALRRLSGEHATTIFETLPGVSVSTDSEERLCISIPQMENLAITSNDHVEVIDAQHFIWKGRIDHVINSGGLKIYPELLEAKLAEYLACPFFIHKEPDTTYGERVVLCIVNGSCKLAEIESAIARIEESRHRPKLVYEFVDFHFTSNGKLRRDVTFTQKKKRILTAR